MAGNFVAPVYLYAHRLTELKYEPISQAFFARQAYKNKKTTPLGIAFSRKKNFSSQGLVNLSGFSWICWILNGSFSQEWIWSVVSGLIGSWFFQDIGRKELWFLKGVIAFIG